MRPRGTEYKPFIEIWDVKKGRRTATLEGVMNPDGLGGGFSSNEKLLAVFRTKRDAIVVRCDTGEIVATIDEPKVGSVCLSPSGKLLGVGCYKFLAVYEVETQKRILRTELGARVKCFDVAESRLLTDNLGYDVFPRNAIIDIQTGTLQRLPAGSENAKNMLYSADGRRIYLAQSDKLVVCSADDGSLLAEVSCLGTPDLEKIEEASEIFRSDQ